MPGRGRRVALVLAALALALALGRAGAVFLTERLWESTLSEAVAVVGTRRAVLGLALELAGVLVAAVWLTGHFVYAARIALPDRAPPEREDAQLWPARLPRWTLAPAACLVGIFAGAGAGSWLDEVLLTLDGVKLGVTDPLLNADLGSFLREIPLWIHVQRWTLGVTLTAVAGGLLLHLSGRTVRLAGRRLGVSPRARGQVAVLLATLALALAWGAILEPYHLAAGDRGPVQGSEFVLRMLIAEVSGGLLAAAAGASLLWWLRPRGLVVAVAWVLAAIGLAATWFLPLRRDGIARDHEWQASVRALDSVAFALSGLEDGGDSTSAPLALLTPSLWDEPVLRGSLGAGGSVPLVVRSTVPSGGRRVPVWLVLRVRSGPGADLLAISDDAVSGSGGPLSWKQGDTTSLPEPRSYLDLLPGAVRSGAPAVGPTGRDSGIPLSGWPRRIMLAWALQAPAALRGNSDDRLDLRLDPTERLKRVIPFVHWTKARPIPLESGVVWESDGLLVLGSFPSSSRVEWGGTQAALVRPALVGTVDAASGKVGIYRADDADSISAALARISRPLIRRAAEIPSPVRESVAYPEDLLLAQAEAVSGPAWGAGRMDLPAGQGPEAGITTSAGGAASLVPFVATSGSPAISAVLLAERTRKGDLLRLVRFDSLHAAPSRGAARERWDRLPFQFMVRDSVRAVKDSLDVGEVRYQLTREGLVAYQPSWSIDAEGRARLAIVNVAMGGDRMGTGRTWVDAWRNFRNEVSPLATGAGASAILEQARYWIRQADSALRRSDLAGLGRALANLRDLLEPGARKP